MKATSPIVTRWLLPALLAGCLMYAASFSSALAADAVAAGDTNAVDDADPSQRRTLLDTIVDGGVTGALIILLSVVATGLIVLHALRIRKPVLAPHIPGLEEAVRQRNVAKAIAIVDDQPLPSLLGTVVKAGLERYRGSEFGSLEYRAAVEEAGEQETGRLYRMTDWLGLIGSIAPMLGLAGTVLGMIDAFNEIALTRGAAKPEQLAGGIGKALITTLLGLFVAIPSMIAYSVFRSRIDSIASETGAHVEQLLMPLGVTGESFAEAQPDAAARGRSARSAGRSRPAASASSAVPEGNS